MAALKGKILPFNKEAELATLGALLLDSSAIGDVSQLLRVDDFYINAHKLVFSAILNLYNEGNRRADILTLIEELKRTGNLEAVGGEPFVASLTNEVPTTANVDYYAGVVRDNAVRRGMITTAAELTALSYDETRETRQVLEDAEQKIFELTDRGEILDYKSTYDTIGEVLAGIEKRYKNKSAYTGIPSGYSDLDKLTGGFQNSEFIIIGARPSIGKTALALNMATKIAVYHKIPTAFFSLEMSDLALVTRILSSETKIEYQTLTGGFYKQSDYPKIIEASGRISDAPLYTIDMPNMKMLDLRSLARRLKSKEKIEIIFIDYLQLISTDRYDLKEYEKVSDISRSLKSLARELNIPVIALSQLGRPAEGQKPGLASLRGSGAIEQDADVVMMLNRKRVDTSSEEKHTLIETELNLEKQRNGPVGTLKLLFNPAITQFYSEEKERT